MSLEDLEIKELERKKLELEIESLQLKIEEQRKFLNNLKEEKIESKKNLHSIENKARSAIKKIQKYVEKLRKLNAKFPDWLRSLILSISEDIILSGGEPHLLSTRVVSKVLVSLYRKLKEILDGYPAWLQSDDSASARKRWQAAGLVVGGVVITGVAAAPEECPTIPEDIEAKIAAIEDSNIEMPDASEGFVDWVTSKFLE